MAFFIWLESTFVGTWIKESIWGFPFCLVLHAWAMAFLVGISLLLCLSVLGLTPGLLKPLLKNCAVFIWPTFVVSLISGLLLLTTYPDKTLTNPVFFVKLGLIAVAVTLLVRLIKQCSILMHSENNSVLPVIFRIQAVGILVIWFFVITAGRLLYYTY